MSLTTRRIIASLFILTFIIGAPILVIYTAGYRYNIKKNTIQKSGALVLKTEPTRADVFLNQKKLPDTTPVRLNNILPDIYNITIEKTGFYSWSKQLEVKSQKTTFAEDIILFEKTLPEKIIEMPIKEAYFSPNKKYAILIISDFEQDYLYLLNLNNGKINLIFDNNKNFNKSQVIWAEDDSKFFFQTDTTYIVFPTLFPQNYYNLSADFNKLQLTKPRWAPHNSNFIYSNKQNQIYRTSLITQETELAYTVPETQILNDFLIFEDSVYIIGDVNKKPYLIKHNLNTGTQEKSLELNNNSYSINTIYNYKLSITDHKTNTFFLVGLDIDKILYQKNNILNVDYHLDKNYLLLQTNQEMSYLNLSDQELKEYNITRYSGNLQKAIWHESSNYALSLQDNKISIIELDERDYHFTISIPVENIIDFCIDSKGDSLYYIQDNFLWQLEI